MAHTMNKQHYSSPRWRLSIPEAFRAIGKTLLIVLSTLTPNSAYSQELFSNEHIIYSPEFVGNYLNPFVFAQLEVQSDETGAYVQIDDMRFRVDEARISGYTGINWREGLFVYELAPEVENSPSYKTKFEQACKEVSSHASLTCVERSKAPNTRRSNYVFVRNDHEENSSGIGMQGGKQIMKIKSWTKGVIMHEILHALGWIHEHNRPNRNQYVEVNWEKIIPDEKRNFYIDSNAYSGSAYDFRSIMHYPTYFFLDKKAGKSGKTLEPLPKYSEMENLMGSSTLSNTDILELTLRYGKPGSKWCGHEPRYNPRELCVCRDSKWCCDGDSFCRNEP